MLLGPVGGWLSTTVTGRAFLAMLGMGMEVQGAADGVPPGGGGLLERRLKRQRVPGNLGVKVKPLCVRITTSATRFSSQSMAGCESLTA
jgi:hypothetical protein